LELGGLRADDGEPDAPVDVEVRRADSASPPQDLPSTGSWYRLEAQQSRLVWEGIGSLLIQDGRRISYRVADDATLASATQAVLGPAMGLLLQQRGLFPLHASAMSIDGVAIGIAGDSGMGKSTLAQTLHARRHALVTDDIAALSCHGDEVTILPGHAALRLWPDSVRRLGRNPEALARLHGDTEKRRMDLGEGYVTNPLRLAGIVILCDAEDEHLERLPPPRAALELLRHYYYPELTGSVAGPGALLQQCSQLAERLEVYQLHRRRVPEAIDPAATLIESCRESPRVRRPDDSP
jgi:hypothetical protein